LRYLPLLLTMWHCSHTRVPARRFAEALAKAVLLPLGRLSSRWNSQILQVGITGSAGKTTTKDLVYSVLSTRWAGIASRGTRNRSLSVLESVACSHRGMRFCVQELGAFGPGTLDELLYVFLPDIAIVTSIGMEHYKNFRSLEAVAAEKAKLVMGLPKGGLAVLNADDPSVARMREVATCRTVLAGRNPNADLRAEEVCSNWPDPLSMVVSRGTDRFRVRTQLYGEQWVFPILAAVELGRSFGIPTPEICSGIADCPPAPGRMSTLRTPDGVDWLCDDWKAPVWSFEEALKQLRQARAKRKVLVLGSFSDSPLKPRRLYARLARTGRRVAHQVCLVGQHAHHGLRARQTQNDESILAFPNATEVAVFLGSFLREEDLVLVKATATERGRLSAEILSAGTFQ